MIDVSVGATPIRINQRFDGAVRSVYRHVARRRVKLPGQVETNAKFVDDLVGVHIMHSLSDVSRERVVRGAAAPFLEPGWSFPVLAGERPTDSTIAANNRV